MSVVTERHLKCDGTCDTMFSIGYGHTYDSVNLRRKWFREIKWHRYKGEDFCDKCWEKQKKEKRKRNK